MTDTYTLVENVNVAYSGNQILKDVNFKIDNIIRPGLTQGQVECLLAPSGMGKSQLFRVLAGLKTPDSGKVIIDGDSHPGTGKVGVVAQDYPLFCHLTVLDNLLLSAKLTYGSEAEARSAVIAMLDQFQLLDKVKCYPHQISGGQRQRIAIIQQMLHCRGLLLMDEPFSGLDPLMKKKVQNFIVDVASHDEHLSIIVTTHDIASAVAISDTIMLLGRDKDPQGNIIPGAYVKFKYDLISMGLAWHPEIHETNVFSDLVKEINARFYEL